MKTSKAIQFPSFKMLCLLVIFFNQAVIAQENLAERKSININNQALFQIDFTSPINNQTFVSPANPQDYYQVRQQNDNKSITIQTDKAALPPTVLDRKSVV